MADKKKRSILSAFADLVLGFEDDIDNDDIEDTDENCENTTEINDNFKETRQEQQDYTEDEIKEAIAISIKQLTEENKAKDNMDTIISKSVVINGDLTSDSSTISVYGTIIGNVKCSGHLILHGTITGNVETNELSINGGRINGQVTINNNAIIKEDSQIHGDITANNLNSNGFIDGNIHANKVVLLANAIVDGDINYQSLAVENGAKLKGAVNILNG